VAAWRWLKPILPGHPQERPGNADRWFGSPPEKLDDPAGGRALVRGRACSILRTVSKSGFVEVAGRAFGIGKADRGTSGCKRFVRSTLASTVWLVCRVARRRNRPGKRVASVTTGLCRPRFVAKGPLLHLQVQAWRRKKTISRKSPWSGQCFSMTTLPPSSNILASNEFALHSGQSDWVGLGQDPSSARPMREAGVG